VTTPRKHVVVTAAVIERDGRFLVTRRLSGTHLAGMWEFPGGKCELGETPEECLRREIREELGVGITVGPKLLANAYDYDDRTVELLFFSCDLDGEPSPQLRQEMQWVSRADLRALDLPPADAELIAMLTKL
jgi:8-oxo-dGTP diphosphatase